MPTAIRKFRPHHVRNIFFGYVRTGRLPSTDYRVPPAEIVYPIAVTELLDDTCHNCGEYERNKTCIGISLGRLDRRDAEILGISAGSEYTASQLAEIFGRKIHELGFPRGLQDGYELLKIFYKYRGNKHCFDPLKHLAL